jgi:hypothetical protein
MERNVSKYDAVPRDPLVKMPVPNGAQAQA